MDRFGPTGKVSKKLVHLLRWSSFPRRTGLNFGWMDRAQRLLGMGSCPSDMCSRIGETHFTRDMCLGQSHWTHITLTSQWYVFLRPHIPSAVCTGMCSRVGETHFTRIGICIRGNTFHGGTRTKRAALVLFKRCKMSSRSANDYEGKGLLDTKENSQRKIVFRKIPWMLTTWTSYHCPMME